jgi:very-short-patch-repair endonuclease
MGGQSGSRDAALALLAGRQHGVVAARQLLALGFTRRTIERMLRRGWLHILHRGVYAVGHRSVTREGWFMAAVLACGDGAVLSHWAAAAHWRLLAWRRAALIDVSVVGHRKGARGIRTHRLTAIEHTLRDRIPITTVERTLLDLASIATPKQLKRATNEAERKALLKAEAVHALVERHRGRKGIRQFAAATAAVNAGTRRSRSDLEVEFLELCAKYRIRPPVANARLHGHEVDMHWPGTRLIVELDGYEYHRTPTAFEQDRRRDAELKLLGYTVIRVTGAWMATDPGGLARTIRQLLRTT